MKTKIFYESYTLAWEKFPSLLQHLIITEKLTKICEIGGGANPLISVEFIKKYNIDYCVVDIDSEELDKADNAYRKELHDVTKKPLNEKYDLIFSKMVMEHIKDIKPFHENIQISLRKGGLACHFFPTLFNLPMLMNLLIPDFITDKLVFFLQQNRDKKYQKKFKPYYKWCFGPTKSNIKRFEDVGYFVDTYYGFFGHSYYSGRFHYLHRLELFKTKLLIKKPNPFVTVNGIILLKKL